MPAEFKIAPEHRLVVSRGSGEFTHADYLDHMAQVKADPQFSPDFNQIVDCRPILTMNLTSDQVRDLAGRSVFGDSSRRAFVVWSDLQYGLTRMFAAHREMKGGQEVQVFRSMLEALDWLGLPRDYLD